MRDLVKDVRLSIGQVLVILANFAALMVWGMRIESSVENVGTRLLHIEQDVAVVQVTTARLDILHAVLAERVERLHPPAPVKDF